MTERTLLISGIRVNDVLEFKILFWFVEAHSTCTSCSYRHVCGSLVIRRLPDHCSQFDVSSARWRERDVCQASYREPR